MKDAAKKDVLLIVGILLIIIVSVFGFFFFNRYVEEEKAQYEQEKQIHKVEELMNPEKSINEKEYEHELDEQRKIRDVDLTIEDE